MADEDKLAEFLTDIGDGNAPSPASEAAIQYTVENPDAGMRSYTLLYPLKGPTGDRLTVVSFRMPGGEDIDEWLAGDGSYRALAARLAGLDEGAFAKMRWPDLEAIFAILADMLPGFINSDIGSRE